MKIEKAMNVSLIVKHLESELVKNAVKVKSGLIFLINSFLREKGFIELFPTILSPITDPLNHDTYISEINVYNSKFYLTQSMILHKQMALKSFEKIFIMSPNVRFESESKKSLGRYLFEFIQVDMEIKKASYFQVMDLIEDMLISVFTIIKKEYSKELQYFKRDLKVPEKPFKKIKYLDAYNKYGKDFEKILSEKEKDPVWLINIPVQEREFYDKLSMDGKTLKDMDLILPEGYGEVLSGGERENEYDKILYRMNLNKNDPEDFTLYLDIVKNHNLPESAGCGIGLERLTRYICGLSHVKYTRLFPKVPGEYSI